MTRVVKIEKTGGPEVLKFETVKLDKPGPEEVLIEYKFDELIEYENWLKGKIKKRVKTVKKSEGTISNASQKIVETNRKYIIK